MGMGPTHTHKMEWEWDYNYTYQLSSIMGMGPDQNTGCVYKLMIQLRKEPWQRKLQWKSFHMEHFV